MGGGGRGKRGGGGGGGGGGACSLRVSTMLCVCVLSVGKSTISACPRSFRKGSSVSDSALRFADKLNLQEHGCGVISPGLKAGLTIKAASNSDGAESGSRESVAGTAQCGLDGEEVCGSAPRLSLVRVCCGTQAGCCGRQHYNTAAAAAAATTSMAVRAGEHSLRDERRANIA